MNRKLKGFCYTIPGIFMGVIGAASCSTAAKDISPIPPDYVPTCGLMCPDDTHGVASGNVAISGEANVDAFFASVVHFQAAANQVSSGIQAELDAIGASVGATAGDNADLKTKLAAKISGSVSGGLEITYHPPACQVSASATVEAQAKCEGTVTPPSASVRCDGSCNVAAGAQVDCGAFATLSCTGTAPNLQCSGSCKGECQLDTTAACSGTCNGTCTGNCSVKDASGNCQGSCDGTCKGTCRLDAAAECKGECKGECTYTPPSGSCEAGAQAHCDAKAGAQVDCSGSCSGTATPPRASAECDASAKTEANVSATCAPPSLNVSYQLTSAVAGDATASAEFQAWVEGFKGHVAAILAYKAKLNTLTNVATDIGANAETAIKGSIETTIKGNITIKATVGLGCALVELPKAIELVKDTSASLAASSKAAVDVLGSVGVS